ncbi:MAG: hypothetical protein AAB473_02995 [Patescibacteria group bacterium]
MTPYELIDSNGPEAEVALLAAFTHALGCVLPHVASPAGSNDPEVLLAFYRWESKDHEPKAFHRRAFVSNEAVPSGSVRGHIAATVPIAQAFGSYHLGASSLQGRDEAAGVLGGGVRINRDFVFITTGKIPEWAREMVSILTAVKLELLSPIQARLIALASDNTHLLRHTFAQAETEKEG